MYVRHVAEGVVFAVACGVSIPSFVMDTYSTWRRNTGAAAAVWLELPTLSFRVAPPCGVVDGRGTSISRLAMPSFCHDCKHVGRYHSCRGDIEHLDPGFWAAATPSSRRGAETLSAFDGGYACLVRGPFFAVVSV